APGLDYGWNIMEGAHCFRSERCDRRGRVMPAVEYGHQAGCSVTGGFVYRGKRFPVLAGHYFYADYCGGWIRSFKYREGSVSEHRQWRDLEPGPVTSFGEDAAGELYVCSGNGRVYRLGWAGAPAGRGH
ncbi:MAG: glucose dehydrogenase, partial [Candidatus Eisenbacteria bacterium]